MISSIIIVVASFILICVIVLGMCLCRLSEKKNYNNGICPKCGEKLVCTDIDSQGGRCYSCKNDNCDYTCWISYNVDKNYKEC